MRLATRWPLRNLVDLAVGKGVVMMIVGDDLYDGNLNDTNTGLFLSARSFRNHGAESVITDRLPLPDGTAKGTHSARTERRASF